MITPAGAPRPKLRFPTKYACPVCNRKTLNYAEHPHAFGWKDYEHVYCRSCRAVFKATPLFRWIARTEDVLTKDGRWPEEYMIKKEHANDTNK